MEPLLPSEVARLIYGYLKKERNEDAAECFLKSSPHLTECYQMFKVNRNFNLKVNGFNLHDIFDIFGTMCSMINEQIPESCESKTLIEKLQYLLSVKHTPINEDKCVETELKMIDKCIGCMVNTENKSTRTTINSDDNEITTEVLKTPSFSEIIPCNGSKTKEIDIIEETSTNTENNSKIYSSPCLSSTSQLLTNKSGNVSNFSEEKKSPLFQINEQVCSTPTNKIEELKISAMQNCSPKNIQHQFSFNQPEYQQVPEATSLESMPGLSKEDRVKDSSVIIDTGELVDTFLSDQSLLEKIADTINKSIEIQKETSSIKEGNVLDPPTLEKALDSTQSDPQIKNVLDEFLVFNVDNPGDNKKACNDSPDSIKSRLRSAKKNVTDDIPGKSKKNNLNTPKLNNLINEECAKIDTNIVLIHEGNMRSSIFENYDLLSHQVVLQPNGSNIGQSMNFQNINTVQVEDYMAKANYVKIAPKISTMLMTRQAPEKRIFPKRKKRSLEEFGIRSKFRKSKINSIQPPGPIQPQPIIIEVPNQNSIETQTKNNKEVNNVISLSEISKTKNIAEDTPNDRLKPPKNKSMSTPRRRSTHIRCLDFSTPQTKSNNRDQARSKLFCDSPKKCEKILEEPSSSPLPKLQADWGSVNGFESIVRKENVRHWDTDIREMVGAGILTSDADGRKTRKKKTPRKKIKSANDKNNTEPVIEEQNNSIQENELTTDETIQNNISEKSCDLNDQNSSKPLLDDIKSSKEQNEHPVDMNISDKATKNCSEKKTDSLKSFSDLKSLIKPNEFSISLETSDKVTDLYNETPSILSDSIENLNGSKLLKHPSEFPISLETPDKVTDLYSETPSILSDSLKNINDPKLLKHPSEYQVLLETPDKAEELNKQSSMISDPLKCLKNPKSSKKISEYPVLLETPNKFDKNDDKSSPIESKSPRNSCESQNNLELLNTNINEQENNLNQSNTVVVANTCNTSTISNTLLKITENCNEKDSSFSETLINHNCLEPLSFKQPENKKNESDVNFEKHALPNQIKTNDSNELSPVNSIISTQPMKQNQVETPYKCDDSAVDVPETPISKLIREYDPSKLVTPLPCTPEHYEDSLTETPLTKVFRETSYLNRPPISPFPPTPGNSMSVDTLILPLEQDNAKISHSNDNKINGIKECPTQPLQTTIKKQSPTPAKKAKVKSTPFKAKQKLSTKSKVKNGLKKKSDVDGKKKQVYESVKAELFGSVISSSSSADELEKTDEHKTIIINKKTPKKEKTSGFKPIPKRKSIQSTNIADNNVENGSLNESNTKVGTLPLLKSIANQNNKITLEKTKKISSIKQLDKSKKSMVHFDDPVEESFNSPLKQTSYKIRNKNEIQNKTSDNHPEQLIGLSRYLNKSSTYYERNPIKKQKTKTETKTSKLNKSDSSINHIDIPCEDKTKLMGVLNNKTLTHISNERNKSFENCLVSENKKSNKNKNSTAPIESKELLDSVQSTSSNTKISNANCILKKEDDNKSFENYESVNNSMKNTSCVTVGHNDELEIHLKKVNDPLNNIEYLKKPKIYEVITEDGDHEMVYLKLSEAFVFLNLPSELEDVSQSNSVPSPLLTKKKLDISLLEPGELNSDCDIHKPITSTPKDVIEKKDDQKLNRGRRSPSFWEDSVHNYPVKYRDDRHRDSNRWSNKFHRDNRYDKKSWSNKSWYHDNRFRSQSQWNQGNAKREFSDNSMRDKERSKYRDDKRRSYRDFSTYDDRKLRDRLEESERFSNTQRKLQNDSQKLNRAEDIIKKATKRPSDRMDYKIPAKVSKVEHQRLLKNVDVDEFLCVVHGQK